MLLEYLDVPVVDDVSCGILIVLWNTFCLPEVQWKRYAKDKFSDSVMKQLKWRNIRDRNALGSTRRSIWSYSNNWPVKL